MRLNPMLAPYRTAYPWVCGDRDGDVYIGAVRDQGAGGAHGELGQGGGLVADPSGSRGGGGARREQHVFGGTGARRDDRNSHVQRLVRARYLAACCDRCCCAKGTAGRMFGSLGWSVLAWQHWRGAVT